MLKSDEKNNEKQYILNKYIEKSDEKFTTWYLFYCVSIAILSSFNFGYNVGMYNTPWKVIRDFCNDIYFETYGIDMPNTKFAEINSIINGLLPLGGIIGSLFSGTLADGLGRKNSLFIINFLIIISAVFNGSAYYIRSVQFLMIGRFIAGIYCGVVSGILPLYLNELPPKDLRGKLGSMNQLTIILGILCANVFGLTNILGNEKRWTILVSFSIIPAVLQMFGLLFVVESPTFLFNNYQKDKAIINLYRLRQKNNVSVIKQDLEELFTKQAMTASKNEQTWINFLTNKSVRWPLFIGVVLKISQFLTGINSMAFYSSEIFSSAGFKGNLPTYSTIILSIVQIFMTFICMILIERVGRRNLMLSSSIGMCIFAYIFTLSRAYANQNDNPILHTLVIVNAIGYLLFYAIGLGPVTWIIVTELFETSTVAKASMITSFFSWLSNFVLTSTFPSLEMHLHDYSFTVYGSFLLLISIFIYAFVPETQIRRSKNVLEL